MGDKVKEIGVFVDESGTFDPDVEASRFYIVCMVFHDQAKSIEDNVQKLNDALAELGLPEDHAVHAVLSILQEGFKPFGPRVEFIENVIPAKYRLFQAADMIATLELLRAKLRADGHITTSEKGFFESIQKLNRAYLKPLSRKLWE